MKEQYLFVQLITDQVGMGLPFTPVKKRLKKIMVLK
jgi:hypothetical protein